MGSTVAKTRTVIRRLGDLRLATDLRMRFLIPIFPLIFALMDGWFASFVLVPVALAVTVAACASTAVELVREFRSDGQAD